MSDKINQIVEELKTLTLLEASELVTAIEETFGVDASASVGGGIMMAAAPAVVEEVEEKTQFNVMLDEVPADKKIDWSFFNRFRYKVKYKFLFSPTAYLLIGSLKYSPPITHIIHIHPHPNILFTS